MSETHTRRYPLDDAAARAKASASVALEALASAARLSLRIDPAEAGRIGDAFGPTLPLDPCRYEEKDGRAALWLGPDEWLLVAPGADGPALFAELKAVLGETPHSLVDVSERSVAIAVTGPNAANLLNTGCPLDLSLAACPIGFSSRTVLAKSEIVLARRSEERFEIDVWRSFAPYVWMYLETAQREFLAAAPGSVRNGVK